MDRQTALQDLNECRRAAYSEAWRQQSFGSDFGPPRAVYFPNAGRHDYFFARQRAESDRFASEGRLATFCMRNKGYELNAIPAEITPAVPPR